MFTGPLPTEVDHRKLAAARTRLQGTVPVSALTRLAGFLAGDGGEIQVDLLFRKGRKQQPLVIGECRGDVTVVCQTCLEEMPLHLEAGIRSQLVDSDDELQALRQSEDGQVCADDTVMVIDLIEDDLILALPMVPRHAEGECERPVVEQTPLPDDRDASGAATGSWKPFERLDRLLRRESTSNPSRGRQQQPGRQDEQNHEQKHEQ